MKKDVGSARYGARISPYCFSILGRVPPTRIGIRGGYSASDLKCRESILYMYGKCISMLCSVSSLSVLIVTNFFVASNSSTIFLSMTRSPNGVSYLSCLVSAQPGRPQACEGPRRKIRFALERSRHLYAQAAAGPEYV